MISVRAPFEAKAFNRKIAEKSRKDRRERLLSWFFFAVVCAFLRDLRGVGLGFVAI